VTIAQEELAGCLRSWRERLSPAEAGLPAGRGRRTPGLRREEVVGLAGVSLDYLARLEQGRAQSPSPSVLASLARALRLTDDERAHLFRLAGHVEPGPGTINRHITPSLQRLLDRLSDVPVMVIDAASEVVVANYRGDAGVRRPVRAHVAPPAYARAPAGIGRRAAPPRHGGVRSALLRPGATLCPGDAPYAERIAPRPTFSAWGYP
jgi:transcriptional regulator with XRE-family HTH domain